MSQQEDSRPSSSSKRAGISRREFALRAALVSAAATCATASVLPAPGKSVTAPQQPPSGAARLSAESQAEADARVEAILARHSAHVSDTQKDEVRRLTLELQKTLDALRKAKVGNEDSPALYLKPLVEREKKPIVSKRDAGETRNP